jgi:hypothetical protein
MVGRQLNRDINIDINVDIDIDNRLFMQDNTS